MLFTHACHHAKISRTTWRTWEVKKPRLENLRLAAEGLCDTKRNRAVEDAFYKTLLTGKAHPISYIFYLTNRESARWKDKRAVANTSFVNKVDVNNDNQAAELAEIQTKQDALLGRLAERFQI